MPKFPRIALAAWLFVSLGAGAAEVPGLFTASAEVLDQSAEQRDLGLRQALAEVLIRLTGDRSIHAWADTEAILLRAPALVQRYSFEALPEPAADGEAGQSGADVQRPRYRLQAVFDGRAVEAAAREAGLPIWGRSRPRHLLWLAISDERGPRSLIDQDSAQTRAAAILEAARARGIPLTFPLLDLEDRRNLEFADVWGGFSERVLAASARYDAPQVVTAAIGREGGLWVGRWTLLNRDGPVDSWVVTELTPEAAMAEGVHVLADRQAARLAVRSGNFVQTLALRVNGIGNLFDYGRVLGHLEGLNSVQSVQVAEITPGSVLFRLRVEGDRDTLANELALVRMLEPVEGDSTFASPLSGSTQEYRLVR